jgi:hypothetical protein
VNTVGKICTVIVLIGIAWAWANWGALKMAFRYREELRTAAEAGQALQDLGVVR